MLSEKLEIIQAEIEQAEQYEKALQVIFQALLEELTVITPDLEKIGGWCVAAEACRCVMGGNLSEASQQVRLVARQNHR